MGNLNFYQVDMKYVRNLAKTDSNVLSVSPQSGKETRPFLGIIIICGDKQYCIPLSSPKAKHISMKNREDFSRILDKNGKIIGALNFNNMIPVSPKVITKIDIDPKKSDTYSERGRKLILNLQLDWCNENKEIIERKANKLYRMTTSESKKFYNLTKRCCDFKKLEQVLQKYIENN